MLEEHGLEFPPAKHPHKSHEKDFHKKMVVCYGFWNIQWE